MHRQGIEDLVRQHYAAESACACFTCVQRIQPLDSLEQTRQALSKVLALPAHEFGARFEDEVAARQYANALQFGQHVGSKRTGTGADFKYITACKPQDISNLYRKGPAKKRCHLRRRDEVALRAELL